MKKIRLLALFLALFSVPFLKAQNRQITGTVSSAEDGSTFPGVTVSVKGTTTGTITDLEGNYKISVRSDAGALVFSYVGMQTQEVEIGNQTKIDVSLKPDLVGLDEVVVTAIGISRQKKTLGYSVSEVESDEITKARETNFLNSLSGKVSGLRVSQQSGTVGGSSKIMIRGANSLGGDNQPLFVVDGVPISNNFYDPDVTEGGVDNGNRAGDINPDDIQSISVLKGASAAALYGARAKNGALIITTKRGNKRSEGVKVELNASYRFDNPLKLPDFQNGYAQGSYGKYDIKNLNGWGPKISEVQDQQFEDFKGDMVTLQAYPDNVKNFFQTGVTAINSASVSGGNASNDYRLGYTNSNLQGIIPGSEYIKNNVSLNAGREFNDKLSARASVLYINSNSTGRPAQGSNDPNILVDKIFGMPRTVSNADLKNNWIDENGKQISMDGDKTVNNPYWIINKNKYTTNLERVISSTSLVYSPLPWLKITERAGLDFFNEDRRKLYTKGTLGELNGKFVTWNLYNRILNNDLIASINTKITKDLKLDLLVGHNLYQTEWSRQTVTATDLTIPELYTYSNAKSAKPENFYSIKRLTGLYGDLTLNYKEYLFVSLTGRNDWSSTLPVANHSYFYPSVSTSFIFTELIPKNNLLNYGKLRVNWANVGSDEEPYQLDFQYRAATEYYVQYSLNGDFPHGNIVGVTGPRIYPLQNLKPQNQNSFEAGADLRFLAGRIGFDFTYYHIKTTQQIVEIAVPLSTGYFNKNLNVGEVSNKGFEFDLSVKLFHNPNGFNWETMVNFNTNKQIVNKLAPGLDTYMLTSGWSGLQIKAQEGDAFGLYGSGWKRNENGEFVINVNTGLREITPDQRFGNIFPDWTMGVNNMLSYKGLQLSFLIDIRQGGVFYSGTVSDLRTLGLTAETLENRGQVFIDKGVNELSDGSYVPNTTPVQSMQNFWGNYASTSNTEGNVFDASYVKLREVKFAYSLPSKWLGNTFFNSVALGVEGRNIWIINDHVPHVDPEMNFFGPNEVGEGVEFSSIPSTRSFGFNVNLTF
ncbi:MAG TPA: SusC/RagA family TonB-linked outer membrane protein [Bacteroidales bacterium]|nr:SusC/RagA family TonB-linked outer membrane protein [Bacteroidales bacterium]